jgi:hypothetical protein
VEAAFARLAWFDVNGDGHIDNRSPIAGGDGTLLVPKHAVKLQAYSREVHRQQMRPVAGVAHERTTVEAKASPGADTTTPGGEPTVAVSSPSSSDVQTRQAIDAYQRYGQPTDNAPTERAVA